MDNLNTILEKTGMGERLINAIVDGDLGFTSNADGEFCGKASGLVDYRDEYQEKYAKEIASSFDGRIDVGMKYPDFNYKTFAKKFNAEILGYVNHPRHPSIGYTVVKTKVGIFSFGDIEKNNDHFSYTGFVANNEADCFEFLEWFLGNSKNYIKDLELGRNVIGGFSKTELDNLGEV